jgi:hypothetical protein
MKPLRVYVSASCFVCDRTREIVAEVRAQRPAYPVELIDLDQPGAVKPASVFGTPTYLLGERIVSLGNPSPTTLLNLLDTEAADLRVTAPEIGPV